MSRTSSAWSQNSTPNWADTYRDVDGRHCRGEQRPRRPLNTSRNRRPACGPGTAHEKGSRQPFWGDVRHRERKHPPASSDAGGCLFYAIVGTPTARCPRSRFTRGTRRYPAAGSGCPTSTHGRKKQQRENQDLLASISRIGCYDGLFCHGDRPVGPAIPECSKRISSGMPEPNITSPP